MLSSAIRARACISLGEVRPRIAADARVFAHRARLALADIWPPLFPRDRPVAGREQAEGLGVIADRSGAAASIFHG